MCGQYLSILRRTPITGNAYITRKPIWRPAALEVCQIGRVDWLFCMSCHRDWPIRLGVQTRHLEIHCFYFIIPVKVLAKPVCCLSAVGRRVSLQGKERWRWSALWRKSGISLSSSKYKRRWCSDLKNWRPMANALHFVEIFYGRWSLITSRAISKGIKCKRRTGRLLLLVKTVELRLL